MSPLPSESENLHLVECPFCSSLLTACVPSEEIRRFDPEAELFCEQCVLEFRIDDDENVADAETCSDWEMEIDSEGELTEENEEASFTPKMIEDYNEISKGWHREIYVEAWDDYIEEDSPISWGLI